MPKLLLRVETPRKRTQSFKTLVLSLALAFLVPQFAYAATPHLDVQLFRPVTDGTGFFSVYSADVNYHLGMSAGAYLNYAASPLEVRTLTTGTSSTDSIGIIIKNRFELTAAVAIGFFDRVQIGLSLPVIWQLGYQRDRFESADVNVGLSQLTGISQGDLRLVTKIHLWRSNDAKFSVGVLDNTSMSTGSNNPYATDRSLTFERMVVMSGVAIPDLRWGLNLGYRARERTEVQTLVIDDEFIFKGAVGYAVYNTRELGIEAIGEIFGNTGTKQPFGIGAHGFDKILTKVQTPVETDLGVRARFQKGYYATVAVGVGLSHGYGAPLPRVSFGMMYYPDPIVDSDNDGISDKEDACVEIPEDLDGFDDNDGCPDLDNDADGIPDLTDVCPMQMEDKDKFQDEDGCPDPDNDADGILDTADKCPDNAEDKDKFKDEDGCPDPDNDEDGALDANDLCPLQPEDVDKYKDEDGCPDPDNDNDGILDTDDKCRDEAEDVDAFQDDDGCPDDNDNDGIPDKLDKCPNEPENYNLVEDTDGCPEKNVPSYVAVAGNRINLSAEIKFKPGSAILSPDSALVLNQLGAVMQTYTSIKLISIEGHTDGSGNRLKNVILSQARAESVRQYLIKVSHIEPERIKAVGHGPDRPIASNATAAGRRQNRRVEILILEQTGQSAAVVPAAPTPGAVAPAIVPASNSANTLMLGKEASINIQAQPTTTQQVVPAGPAPAPKASAPASAPQPKR